MTTGVVTSVTPRRAGGELTATTTTGTTVLQVSDAGDFDEEFDEPRFLVIGEETTPRQYVAVQNDEDFQQTVTLAAAVGAVLEEGLPVTPWDPASDAADKRAVEYQAWVRLDDQGKPIPATIPHTMIPTAGAFTLVGASVRIDDAGGEWQVADVLGREAQVTDIEFVGGSISIAEGAVGTVSTGFSGTSLPTGWTATKTGPIGEGSGGASVPGVSVVSSGPAGQVGSALLVDFGASGLSGTTADAAGEVTTTLPETANAQITVRYRVQVAGDFIVPDDLRLAIRRQDGVAWSSGWDGITLDLTGFEVQSVVNGTGSQLAALPVTTNPSTDWHWAQLRVSQGVIAARVWRDGDEEAAWRTIPQAGVLTPGATALIWKQSTFLSNSRGQKLWVDSWDSIALSSGFTVNVDGSGSWRGQDLTYFEQRGSVNSGAFSAVGVNNDVAVTFPRPFDVQPIVTINPVNATSPDAVHVLPAAITATGFTARCRRTTGTAAFTAHWSAGPPT